MKTSKTYIGILFALLAYFSFSFLDAIQKTTVLYHSIFQILLIKYLFTLTLSYFESLRKKNTNLIISIFAGRAGDVGKDPIPEIKKSLLSARKFKNVKILWASVREPYNFTQASQLGCHIITIPPNIISKIEKFGKSFKNLTNDTVKAFLVDSRKSKFKI